jgi:hypothetical protein
VNTLPLYQHIARTLAWKPTDSFRSERERRLVELQQQLPYGSGIDAGCEIVDEYCPRKGFKVTFGYHKMNEDGYYCGWVYLTARVRPCLENGFDLKITGAGRDPYLREYLHELFSHTLDTVYCPIS